MTSENIPADERDADDVGYKKPPKKHQFPKGKSGNKKGRPPRKSKSNASEKPANVFDGLTRDVLDRKITVLENGKPLEITLAQAIQTRMAKGAVEGKYPSAKALLDYYQKAADRQTERDDELFELAVETKDRVTDYVKHRDKIGARFRYPIPHPYHFKLDWETRTVTVVGPVDADQLHDWTCIIAEMVKAEISIEEAEIQDLDGETGDIPIQREFLESARQTIPRDDPIWLEYAPGYRREILDQRYYYGPEPDLPRKNFDLPEKMKAAIKELRSKVTPEARRRARQMKSDAKQFRAFMREKLPDLMGDEWDTRLKRDFHEERDLNFDRMRWEYEIGMFDPDKYAIDEEEKEVLKNPEFLKAYMAWDQAE